MMYSIPEFNIETLEKKIARIQKKCTKYGCDFKYERVSEHFKEVEFRREIGWDSANACPIYKTWTEAVKYIDVECEGVAKVNGWQYAASLEYTKSGNVISGVPGIEIPKRFYDCEPWCEHCKTARDRKYSFVVFNEETGEFKQVGKSCLKDFTGGLSAEGAALVESYIKTIEESCGLGSGYSGKTYFDVFEFMKVAAETIRIYGYVRTVDSGYSTASRSVDLYRVSNGMRLGICAEEIQEMYEDAKDKGFNPSSPSAAESASAVINWIKNCERDDNYYHNLRVACSLDYCDYGKTGLLVSAFPAYNRELEYEAERRERERKEKEAGCRSKHVGAVGKRISFKPEEVVCVTSWETMYGTTRIYKLTDGDGNVFTWKTSNFIWDDETVEKITGTVKEHKEYHGVKQTELTRCKVEYGKRPEKAPTKEELEANEKAMKEIDEVMDMLCEGAIVA